MNVLYTALYFNRITAQQYLIIILTKRETMPVLAFSFHQ